MDTGAGERGVQLGVADRCCLLQTGAACVYPTGAVSGESRVYFYAPANDPATTRLITPVIDASELVTPARIHFWYALPAFSETRDVNDTLRVYARLSATAEWQLLGELADMQEFWEEATMALPMKSTTLQIAFEAVSHGGRGVVLDDVLVGNTIQCGQELQGMAAGKVTPEAATLSWERPNDFATYNVKVSATEITDFTQPALKEAAGLVDNFYAVDGLTPETTYYFYVQSDCGDGDLSPWTEATFTTDYAPVESFSEDFEDYPSDQMGSTSVPVSGKWKGFLRTMEKATTARSFVDDAQSASGDFSAVLYCYHTFNSGVSAYSQVYLVSPALVNDIDWSTKQLRFKMMTADAYGKVHVGISTHPDVLDFGEGEYEELAVVENYGINTFEEKVLPLSSYEGKGRYIVFSVSGLDTRSTETYYLDDIILEDAGTDCGEMQLLAPQATTTTATGATLTWSDLNATSWNLKVSDRPIDPETTYGNGFTGTVQTASYQVTGLVGGTGYYAYVQPICADGVAGKWSQGGLFFTEVDTENGITVPYYQGFDAEFEINPSTSSSFSTPFPRGWARLSEQVTGSIIEPRIYTTNYSAPAALQMRLRETQYSMVALPKFAADIQDLQLRFKVRAGDTEHNYFLLVGVIPDQTLSVSIYDTYTFVDTLHIPSNEWEEVIVKFDGYKGDGGYIVLMTEKSLLDETSQKSLYIDDLYVEEAGGASAPTDLAGELVNNSTVNLSWQSDASKFEVLYGGEGLSFNDPANKTQAVTGTTTTVSGLEANRTYDFYVRVKEDDGTTSNWAGPLTFTTEQTAATLPYVATFEDEADNAQWTLLNEDFVNAWRIGTATKKQGSRSLYVTMPTNDNSYASGTPQPYLFAYRVIDMAEPGLYDIGFSWKAQGESTNDFMRVFVVPDSLEVIPGEKNGISATATPSGWVTLGGKYNLQSEWQDTVFTAQMFTEAGKYKLLFYWTNNTSTNTSYPPAAAVDSVFFKKNVVCMTPIDVTVDKINDVDAELNFISYNTEAWDLKLSTTEFDVADDKIADQEADVFDGQIDTLSYKMTGLQPSTTYYYYLRTPCNDEWQKGTFTTKCERQPLTVLEYFDESEDFPGCWTKLTNNTGNNAAFPAINTETYYNGKAALEFYAQGSAYYNAAVSPMLDVDDLSKVQVRFYGYSPVATGKLVVGAIEDAADYETIFPIDTLTVEEKGVWEYFEVPFDAYAGKGEAKYVVLMSEKQGAHFLVDSVVIEPIPACRTPRDLVAKENAYSAFLNWNGYGAGAFNVKVSSEPIDPTTQSGDMYEARVQHDTLTVGGLRPLTMYYWYVQAVCGETEMGEWSKEVYFQTLCPYYGLPLRDGFDTYGVNSISSGPLPDCWTVVKSYGNYPFIYGGTTSSTFLANIHSLPASLKFDISSKADNYQIIATPQLYVDDISTLIVSFWVRMKDTGGQLIVGVMDDPSDINTFVPVDTILRVGSDYVCDTVYLSSYEGTGKYVAFSNYNGKTGNEVYLDDVVIMNPNMTCAMPENLQALGVTDTQANLTWSDPAAAEYYNLKVSTYSIVPDMEEADFLTLDSLELRRHVLTGLQPSTTYYVYVQCTCGEDGDSYWASTSFTTLCEKISSYEDDFSTYDAGTELAELCWSSRVDVLTGTPSESQQVAPCINNAGTTADKNMAIEIDPFYDADDGTTRVWAISPMLENLQGKQMTFRYKASYTGRSFPLVVGVMSDWSDVSTFVPIDTLYTNYETGWYAYLMNFSEYADASFVAFMSWADEEMYSTNSNKLYVDDIVIEDIPACASAYDIEVTAVGSATATLTWKAGNASSNAWNYILTDTEVDMSLEGAVDSLTKYQVKTGTANTPTCTIEGLMADTEYWFYLTPQCGTAYFPQGVALHTECDMKLEVPYYEDFTSYGTATSGRNTAFPTCWYRETNNYGSPAYPYIQPQSYLSFPDEFIDVISGSMLYMYTSSAGQYVYVATPEIDTDDMQSLRARFKAGATTANRKMIVGIATNQKDTATFVPLDTVVMEEADVLYEFRVPFEGYTGTGKCLAFMVKDGHRPYLGELNIEENTSCELPINAQASALSDTSLVVSWDRAGAARWEVRYGQAGFDMDVETEYKSVIVTDTFCIITGLEQLTDYDVRVRTLCSDEEVSPWLRPFTVRTLQTPLELPFETAFEDAEDDKLWQVTAQYRSANYPLWAIGNATSSEGNGRSLYLSGDNGATSSYGSSTRKNYTFAYTTVNLTEGLYKVSFKWKGTGDGLNYMLSAFLIPDSLKITDQVDDYDFYRRSDTILVAGGLGMESLTDDAWQSFERTFKVTHEKAGIFQFAFYSENNDEGIPFAVDSVSFVRTAPTTPEFLRLESVTKNTATVDWLSYNASSYTVRLFNKPMDAAQVEDATDYVKEQTVYELPATIEGLSAGTLYYMYVKADGGSGWAEMPFYTACDAAVVNFPVLENFEGLGFGYYAYPPCWLKWNSMTKYEMEEMMADRYDNMYAFRYYTPYVADSLYYNGFYNQIGYEGSDGVLFLSSVKSGAYSMVISPEFEPEVLKDLHVQFYLRHMAASSSRLIVGVMTDASDPSTFIPLDSIEGMTNKWDLQVKGSMRDYEAQLEGIPAKHFALKASNAVNTQLLIDDLRLGRWQDYDVYDQVCKGYSYRGHGFDIDAAELQQEGEQVFTRTALRPAGTMGNDSIIHLHLTVTETLYTYLEDEACEGDVYEKHGFSLSGDELTSGEHRMSFNSVDGCDSVVVLNLTVNKSYLFEEAQKSCPDQLPYTWHGRDLAETGVYYDSLRTVAGCDSIYMLDFQVLTVETTEETIDICEADLPYEWNGLTLTEEGEYSVTLDNVNNCDSIVTLTLRVHQPYDLREEVTICHGGSFSGFGWDNITTAGTYTHEEVSVWDCDSTFTLVVTVAAELATTMRDTICAGDVYEPGSDFTQVAETATEILYQKTIPSQAVADCDSTVTLVVAKLPSYDVDDEVSISEDQLPYQHADTTFDIGTESGEYLIHAQTVAGCDSIVHLTLTVGGSGIGMLGDDGYFNITPNPVQVQAPAYINYDFTEAEKDNMLVEVYTSTGHKLQGFMPEVFPINVGKYLFAPGVYMVRVTTGTGEVLVGRIIAR